MLYRRPIRNKLLVGLGLLVVIVATLAASGLSGVYAYRGLVRSLRDRATELQLASELSLLVGELRVTLSRCRLFESATLPLQATSPTWPDTRETLREEFTNHLDRFKKTLHQYRAELGPDSHDSIGDRTRERETARQIEEVLAEIDRLDDDHRWLLWDVDFARMSDVLEGLRDLTGDLPRPLQARFQHFPEDVRAAYRALIVTNWITSVAAGLFVLLLVRLFYHWIFRPLSELVQGSRRVAAGDFHHRIRLDTNDEMAELAEAMNNMTARFQDIRDDLDRQVRERTRQVVRSEQMASVGFLAAGVAHEINNPLASIAMCAESLEARLQETPASDEEQKRILQHYLRMIQNEAFRCKEITERLLDFSRLGDSQRQVTDLRELTRGVIEMLRHLGKYHDKEIVLRDGPPVFVRVNSQEIKQVALNLITNALESLDPGGRVQVDVRRGLDAAELAVEDNGCGMTQEVQEHLFEPFFTRRRGGQGTGLGLSISYRIVDDHAGQIAAHSDGPGSGSKFVVSLPLAREEKESRHRNQAA